MANEFTPEPGQPAEPEAPAPEPAPAPELDADALKLRLRAVRGKLATLHQRAARVRTAANALSDKASAEAIFLEKVSLDELDAVSELMRQAEESLTALLALS